MKLKAKKIVDEILSELNGRKGFDDWWYNIDEDITEEIENELVDIVVKNLED